jgi:hypothetical protein
MILRDKFPTVVAQVLIKLALYRQFSTFVILFSKAQNEFMKIYNYSVWNIIHRPGIKKWERERKGE